MWSRIALCKYLRYQCFNLWLPLEATSTTCLNWLSGTLLAALHAHRLQIPYWAFQELVVSWILSLESVDYFRTSDYFSGWKKDQSLSAKLWGLYLKTRIEDWGLRIGIGDQGSVIPEKGRKIRILLLLYKTFDPNNHFLYFIDHFPLLFETLYVLLIVVTPSFSLLLMSFCFVTVVSLQSRVKQQISCWCRELLLLWRVTQRKENKNVSFTLHPSWQLFFIVVNDWFRDV